MKFSKLPSHLHLRWQRIGVVTLVVGHGDAIRLKGRTRVKGRALLALARN